MGFIIGAILFSIIGTFAGIWIVAICQASAGRNGADEAPVDGDEWWHERRAADSQPDMMLSGTKKDPLCRSTFIPNDREQLCSVAVDFDKRKIKYTV
jgi:hypothetical protein